MKIRFTNFDKKANSTKIPGPDHSWTELNCSLKGSTSIVSPEVVLRNQVDNFNYCFIPEWNKYYFVGNIRFEGSFKAFSMVEDVLGTYRSEIGSSSQYVLRSSKKYNGEIVDMLYPAKAVPTVVRTNNTNLPENPFVSTMKTGYYVIGVLNDDVNSVGATSYYQLTDSNFRKFCHSLMTSTTFFDGVSDISESLFKSVFNPFQYITSCTWFPISFESGGTSVSKIPYGWYSIDCNCVRLDSTFARAQVSFNVPNHPQKESRGRFLNSSPFSQYQLIWGAFGRFALNPSVVAIATTVKADALIDAVSGNAILNIYAYRGSDTISSLAHSSCQIGVPVQLAQVSQDFAGALNSVAGTASSILTGDFAGAGASIGNAVNSLIPQVTSAGTNGSTCAFKYAPYLECTFYEVSDENLANKGRPLMEKATLSNLNGYIVCDNAVIDFAEFRDEYSELKTYLDGGFYYE